MKRMAEFLAASLVSMVALAQAPPQDPPSRPAPPQIDDSRNLPRLFWDDAVTLAQAPGDWTSRQWGELALGVAAVAVVGVTLDRTVDQAVVRNRKPSWDSPAKAVAQLGSVGGWVLVGGGYLGSELLGKDEARSMWVDAGIATVLSQVAIYPVKMAVGRVRPADGQGNDAFRPFSGNDAFPSGHTTQAFAIASAISMHADNPWVGGAAYGVAGLVGLSRLETRDHFAADVLGGALVGTTIGRAVVRIDQKRRAAAGSRVELDFHPLWTPDFRGLQLVAKF
jgi:membrane-associated phospholipid phosphatase